MKFSDLAIGQIFKIIVDKKPMSMTFRKTDINNGHNCVSLWQLNHECKAHCSLNQEVVSIEELQSV